MMRKQIKNINIADFIDSNRIYMLLILVFLFMSLAAPNFFTVFNLTNILRGASLGALACIGFSIVMISGQLDLSIATVINLAAVFVIGFQPKLGWIPAILIGVLSGALVGWINGLLVAKAKINSFIVTLGTMTILQGFTYMYTRGGSLNITDFTFGDWLEKPMIPLLPPRVIITIVFVIVFEIILLRTRYGKGYFVVGGNKNTAWLAGIKTDRYYIGAFVLSGFTAAVSGVLFAISISSAVPNMGEKGVSPLMIVLAATIIGGTSMAGGKGSIAKSAVAVLLLTMLTNGLNCFGMGYEVQILASGAVLSIVVLYEAYVLYKQDQIKGQRSELLKKAN
ncbi:MAG: ABC transporter permease [Clostridiaceae bacterium]|nr:ABC transporter permease [Clostridiaceae bacterium]